MKKEENPKRAKGIMRKNNKDSQRLSQEMETIAEIGRIISSTLNIDEVYERFAQEAKKLIEFDRIAINIINQKENTLIIPYVWGTAVADFDSKTVIPFIGSATEEVFKTRSSLIIQTEDENELITRFPVYFPYFQAGLRSAMFIPLISQDEVIGSLALHSKKSNAYPDRDLKLAESIGYQIAGAIANAQLFLEHKQAEEALQKSEESARRLAQDNAIVAEVGRIISSTLEIDRVYELFAEEVRKVIPFDRISITVIDHEKGAFHNAYILGPDIPGRRLMEVVSLAGSFTEEIMRRRSSQLIQTEDEDEVAGRFPKLLPFWQRGFRSLMAVPLISQDQVIGVLHIYLLRSQAYKEADVRLAESIGYQIAGAIANAQLFLEHKRAQEALRESEWRFRVAAESASDLIWEWDIGKGEVIWFGNIDETLGYQSGEFPRTKEAWVNIIHPEDRERVMKAFDRHLKNRERYFQEYRVLRKDGTVAYWIGSGTAVHDQEGKPYRMVGSVTDITGRKKMEEELLRSKKLESIGFLSGGIAHDFNNLLTGIMGNISLARLSFHPGDKTLTYLENAENLCVRASELTKKLLTFSKGGTPIKKTVFIGDFLKETVRMPLSGSNVRCELNIPEDLWPVEIDEGQMRQVIYNIVINAREAMPGGGTINIVAENITHGPADRHSSKDGKYVRVSIKDHGVGIPQENLEKIFDPYFSTKEMGSQKGMGLGLAISHSIVKNHGGFITAESIVEKGSTFHVYLPASAREFVPEKEVAKKPLPTKGRVLVMDDDQVVRYIAEKFLKHLGYEVELAEDGKEAVGRFKKAQESKQPFDIVILDLIVPGGIGGKEVLKKLLEISPEIKAIAASGFSNDPILADFKRYGFKGVLAKPF
ncbi:MAG: GAF domain-containing protein, partial [Thermodesulfobacteriota bacterium]|nr:GAF domain-containing protein [Thermodesulfobacteriota bacterium]